MDIRYCPLKYNEEQEVCIRCSEKRCAWYSDSFECCAILALVNVISETTAELLAGRLDVK